MHALRSFIRLHTLIVLFFGTVMVNSMYAQKTDAEGFLGVNVQITNSITVPKNVFLTDDGSLKVKKSGEPVANIKTIKEAEKSKESLPADQDPEGHWGNVTNGFQLSLRFEKQSYTIGEPVIATVLVRNVSGAPLEYVRTFVVGRPSPINLCLWKDQNQLNLKKESEFTEIISANTVTLFPRTQHKYTVALEKFYDLTQSGEYVFQASYASKRGGNDLEIASQKVTITITNASAISTK